MDAPLVSIIIPTYDRPKLLSLTLESIKAQTFTDYEVIVVDDGAPNEETKMVCDRFSKVSYFKIDNSGGPAKPRNIGISKAKGDYIAFIDDDDLWLPLKLAKQVEILDKNPEFGLVHSPCRIMDKDGNISEILIGKPGSPDVKHGNVAMRMAGNWTLMTSSVLVRKKVLEKVGYFSEKMHAAGEDTEFWTRCSFYTHFYYLPEPLVLYRKHESISKKLKVHYLDLPLHLKVVIDIALKDHLIDGKQYRSLLNQVIKKQIKESRGSKWRTFIRLFKLNPFWFLNFGNCKLFVKIFFS
jgi:glycosyltransferase involved in cell wall biosynthesis